MPQTPPPCFWMTGVGEQQNIQIDTPRARHNPMQEFMLHTRHRPPSSIQRCWSVVKYKVSIQIRVWSINTPGLDREQQYSGDTARTCSQVRDCPAMVLAEVNNPKDYCIQHKGGKWDGLILHKKRLNTNDNYVIIGQPLITVLLRNQSHEQGHEF